LLSVALRHRNFCANFARRAKPFLRFKTLVMLTAHWAGKEKNEKSIFIFLFIFYFFKSFCKYENFYK